jgi:citrate synthase
MFSQRTLTAAQAAKELHISLPTLYAYVSRGLIRSERVGLGERERRYLAEDIAQLQARKQAKRDPARAVKEALHWGAPVMDSRLTLISDGRLRYRGHDAIALASAASFEQVAALLWLGRLDAPAELFGNRVVMPAECRRALKQMDGLASVQRMQAVLPVAGAADIAAFDLRPNAVAATGARIVHLLTAIAARVSTSRGPISAALQQRWAPGQPAAASLINAALILCADHELNVSAFTARCVASAGATPYNVVAAGLAALQGARHGGNTERVEALWRELQTRSTRSVRQVLVGYLKRGEGIPGFGHALYPGGDPRAAELFRLMRQAFPKSPVIAQSAALTREAVSFVNQAPTIDVALVVLARLLNLPEDGALTLFALGRSVGWIGHALEQYQTGEMIRPRARYVGETGISGDERE